MRNFILVLLILVTIPAIAEHETEEGHSGRAAAVPPKPQDCGVEIGEATLHYPGRFLFARNTYDLKITFDTDGIGLSIDYNRGTDRSLAFRANEGGLISRAEGNESLCSAQPVDCSERAYLMSRALDVAAARIKHPTDYERRVLECAQSKMARLNEKTKVVVAAQGRRHSPKALRVGPGGKMTLHNVPLH
jgi:hypothetical protein